VSTFAAQPWAGREGSLGDEAEGHYEALAAANGWAYMRFGMNRPPLHVASLPLRIRYMPDYCESKRLVECQGGGYDRKVKIKVEKLNEVTEWNKIHPVVWFLWNRKIAMYAMPAHADVLQCIAERHYTMTMFDETKPVYVLSNGLFTWREFPG
jgi:hypothetical protein